MCMERKGDSVRPRVTLCRCDRDEIRSTMRAMRTSTLAFVFVLLNAIAGCAGGGDDGGGTTPDAPSSTIPVCGDGTCAAAEVGHCPMDFRPSFRPMCGHLLCEARGAGTKCPRDRPTP